jgi:hypothetical protein
MNAVVEAIESQYKAAKNDLFSRIDCVVSPIVYTRLALLLCKLEQNNIRVAEALSKAEMLLQGHASLYKELEAYMLPGTSIYVFTRPGEPMLYRPYFKESELALPWEIEGDHFSKCCAICLGPFCAPIRTLPCKHTFCRTCLDKYLSTKGVCLRECNGRVDVMCPYCRVTTMLGHNVDCHHERAHNSLLLTLQNESLMYACPIDGCTRAFTRANLRKHVGVCPHRKYICDKGCDMILRPREMHTDAQDCIQSLRCALDELTFGYTNANTEM